jgi:hypothetical protein
VTSIKSVDGDWGLIHTLHQQVTNKQDADRRLAICQ